MDEKQLLTSVLALPMKRRVQFVDVLQGALVMETPEGLKCSVRTRKEFGRFMARKPSDQQILDWIRSFEPGEVFYDIGANVGALTLFAGALHRGQVRVVSVEPSFSSFESLVRNLSLNKQLGSTIPLQVALLERTGLAAMNYRSTAAGTSLHSVGETLDYMGQPFTPAEVQQVLTYALDDLIETFHLPPPTRMKIDVDGFEHKLLQGASRTLKAGTLLEINIEVVDHDGAASRLRAIETLLRECGFVLVESLQHYGKTGDTLPIADYLFRREGVTLKHRPAAQPLQDGSASRNASQAVPFPAPSRPTEDTAARFAAKLAAKAAHHKAESTPAAVPREARYYLSGAHKKIDVSQLEGFAPLASAIIDEGRTSMDYDRLYTLWQAVIAAPVGRPIAEIGTYQGGSAKFIAGALRCLGRSPAFYVCDTFKGHVRVDPALDGRHQVGTKFRDTSPESVAQYLAAFSNVRLVVGDFIETSRPLERDGPFGFVHVDVDVYPVTQFCLRFFGARLAAGAVIVVDDYGFLTCAGAKKAVDEFIAERSEFRLLHLLTGQAVLFRIG